jgi:hypothetical protein
MRCAGLFDMRKHAVIRTHCFSPVQVESSTATGAWSAKLNIDSADITLLIGIRIAVMITLLPMENSKHRTGSVGNPWNDDATAAAGFVTLLGRRFWLYFLVYV